MSISSSIPASQQANKDKGLLNTPAQWMWIAVGMLLIGYGLFAFNAGSTISPLTNKAADNVTISTQIMQQASNGVDVRGSEEVLQTIPGWWNFMASISSSEYVYGEDSLMVTQIYYHAMADSRRTILSTHMMLGMVLMTAGFFQFWPAFRRRYRKAHRVTGVVYVVAAFASMTMSGIHLVNTGIANTYDTYAFHVGLWMMLVGVIFSISMAGIAIFRKKVAQHMGWQAVGFGFLLTAPFQRADWIMLAPFAGDLSFNEMNAVVNAILFVQVTLIAYVLFLLNRGSSPLRLPQVSLTPMSTGSFRFGLGVLSVISLFLILTVFTVNSLAEVALLQRMIPNQALALLASEVSGFSIMLFALGIAALMISSWYKLNALRSGQTENALSNYAIYASGTVAGLVSILWAFNLGMPTHEHGVAGAGFFVLGLLFILFLGMFIRMLRKQQWGKAVEWLQFLILTSIAPALFAVSLWILDRFSLVPEPYLSQAAGYELAAIVAVFIPVLSGFILSIYSDETDRYRVL